jgi:anhydro-N-acetylmuramic acid kinase
MIKPAKTMIPMIVAGVMSGTSADGIDVALVRIAPGKDNIPRLKVLGHAEFPYPEAIREAVLRAAANQSTVAETSQLSWRLGELYSDAIAHTAARFGVRPALVGLHGQTIYHQAAPQLFAGSSVRATLQIGEPAVLRERLQLPVISDFRAADLAAGGQGAPLVPMLDFAAFRSKTRNRVLLNLGGIANLTAIPAAGALADVLAFDTGPANMVIDAMMLQLFGRGFDCGGTSAERGKVLPAIVEELLRDPYFAAPPPKSCGREQFGAPFAARLHALCVAASARRVDIMATASELTVRSIFDAYGRFCWTHLGQRAPLARATDLIVAGGGTRNEHLMRRLRTLFTPLGVKVLTSDEAGIASQAKEAVAFALLAWLSFHGLPGNVPSATGASRPVVLGKLTC